MEQGGAVRKRAPPTSPVVNENHENNGAAISTDVIATVPKQCKIRVNPVWELWKDSSGKDSWEDDEIEDALWEMASNEFGGNKVNQQFWIQKEKISRACGDKGRAYRCTYYNQSGCPMKIRTLQENGVGPHRIEMATGSDSSFLHNDHSHNNFKTQMNKQVLISSVSSPSHFGRGPQQLLGKAARKLSTTISSKHQRTGKRQISKLKKKFYTGKLDNGGDGRHYGDIVSLLTTKFNRMEIENFGDHSICLLGGEPHLSDYVNDEGELRKRFYCVLSSENLLLNAYRQLSTGQDLTIAVDASYRYIVGEKQQGLTPIKVINFSQEAKTIAYAICNKEDEEALQWILSTIKIEVERIVNERIALKLEI